MGGWVVEDWLARLPMDGDAVCVFVTCKEILKGNGLTRIYIDMIYACMIIDMLVLLRVNTGPYHYHYCL